MDKGKIEDTGGTNASYSIKMQFNSEEQWTKALKFMLTNLKWGLAWVSTQFTPAWRHMRKEETGIWKKPYEKSTWPAFRSRPPCTTDGKFIALSLERRSLKWVDCEASNDDALDVVGRRSRPAALQLLWRRLTLLRPLRCLKRYLFFFVCAKC